MHAERVWSSRRVAAILALGLALSACFWPGRALGDNGTWTSVGDFNIGNRLGSYGVDVTHHQVWAVVNHNSQFAVVPEPSTLLLIFTAVLMMAGSIVRCRVYT